MARTPDLFAEIGRALYGAEGWISPLADRIGINRKTVTRWMTGHTPLPPDHPAWDKLASLIAAEADAAAGRANRLRALLARK